MQPITKDKPRDPEGQARQDCANAIDNRLKSEPRKVYYVLADGYENAVSADGQYLVYEEYRGTDRRAYDSYRPANRFEVHLLKKIEGLNSFFVE